MQNENDIFNQTKHEKVLFRLEKDEDGYPPDDWESLWATEDSPGLYTIDNVPFFVRGISLGDVVSVNEEADEKIFESIVTQSDHSVIRVIIYDQSQKPRLLNTLENNLGCSMEQSHLPSLVSIDIPPDVDIIDVREFLNEGEAEEVWEYEEASIRHIP